MLLKGSYTDIFILKNRIITHNLCHVMLKKNKLLWFFFSVNIWIFDFLGHFETLSRYLTFSYLLTSYLFNWSYKYPLKENKCKFNDEPETKNEFVIFVYFFRKIKLSTTLDKSNTSLIKKDRFTYSKSWCRTIHYTVFLLKSDFFK